MNHSKSLTALSHSLAELSTLQSTDANTPRFNDWRTYTLRALAELFGEHAPALKEFENIVFMPPLPASREQQESAWRTGRNAAYTLLTTLRFQPYLNTKEPQAQP